VTNNNNNYIENINVYTFFTVFIFALFIIVMKNYQATSDELQLLENFEQEMSKDIVENEIV